MTREEILDKYSETYMDWGGDGHLCLTTEDAGIAMEEYAQSLLSEKWVSVLAGSYKDETLYLLWGDDWSNPQIGSFWTNRNNHGWHDYIGDPLYDVTHYQPLPSPPTK